MIVNDVLIAAPSLQKLSGQDLPLYAACAVADLIDLCNPVLDEYGKNIDAGYDEEAERRKDVDFSDRVPIGMDPMLPVMLSAADVKRLEPFIDFGRPKNLSNSDNNIVA